MAERERVGWRAVLQGHLFDEELNEEIDKRMLIGPVPIKEMSMYDMKRLYLFAKENANDHWGNAIGVLLDLVEHSNAEDELDARFQEIEARVSAMEQTKNEVEKPKGTLAFGGRRIGA